MAQFCEGCPDRGDCTGEITEINILNFTTGMAVSDDGHSAMIEFKNGLPQGLSEVRFTLLDVEGHQSDVLRVSGASVKRAISIGENYPELIEECSGPRRKRLLGLARICGVNLQQGV